MAERKIGLPIETAGVATLSGREVLRANKFTSDNYRDSGEMYAIHGDKWLVVRAAMPDYLAQELDLAEGIKGY